MRYRIIIICIILVAIFVRFWDLEKLPLGFFVDEASQGYNAFSILLTGKDEYGKFLPLSIKSFSTFNPPLYTYLTIPIIYFFGLTIWSVRFISAFTGVGIVIISFLILKNFVDPLYKKSAVIFTACLALAPWGIFFSRGVLEPNLGLFLFLLGLYLLLKTEKYPLLIILSLISFGLSIYSYSAYRIIVLFCLPVFMWILRGNLLPYKKILGISIILLGLELIPMIILSTTPSATKRLSDLDYTHQIFEKHQNEKIINKIWNDGTEFIYEFTSKYTVYYSPRNLFFDPDPDPGKSIPDMSVFYSWMLIPFFYGIFVLIKKQQSSSDKLLLIILLTAPISASLTRDPFATVRTLLSLWATTLVISIGLTQLLDKLLEPWKKIILIMLLLVISTISLYRNYVVLFNFERAEIWGYGINKLANFIHPRDFAVIDQSRHLAVYANLLFAWKYPPKIYQQTTNPNNYYLDTSFSPDRNIANVEIRSFTWGDDPCKDQLLVGDTVLFTPYTIGGHFLTKEFEIDSPNGKILYIGYRTNPSLACPK